MDDFTPTQRRIRITEILQEKESVTIQSLAEKFGVSAMTIHRDAEKLVAEGKVRKVRGGLMPKAPDPVHTIAIRAQCEMCGKQLSNRLGWVVTPKKRSRWYACCSHCGLLQLHHCEGVNSALSADFLYGHMVNVYQAWYVIGSDLRLCCMPSILCFGSQKDAKRFQKGFGGQVANFDAAMAAVGHVHHAHQTD